ncbi:MAG: flagellar biosynthetic protein FliR [Pseudomonadota bacterium]
MESLLTAIFQQTNETVLIAAGIFARVGAIAFLLPGMGERGISLRVRLGGALALTALLAPLITPLIPETPETVAALGRMMLSEVISGLIIGFSFRLLIFALQTAGMVAAQHLSVVQMFGAGVAPEPEPTIATLLAMAGITLALMAGLHVNTVALIARLYDVLPFGQFPDPVSVGDWATARMAETFALGVTLAAPFVAVGFTYNIALGALNRAMPQLLVAVVGIPALLWIGMVVLHHVIPSIFDAWDIRLQRILIDPLGGLG